MNLYFVRHAIAVSRGTPGVLDDRSRELTPRGIKRMERNVAALAKLKLALDEIWTSPLTRAKQTADILAKGLDFSKRPRIVKALEPGQKPDLLLQKLAQHPDSKGIALVGHEPDMGRLASYMLLGSTIESVVFKKGAVARIEIDDFKRPLRGQLHWLLTPKQMQLMA